MRTCRGMVVVGPRLTKAETKARRASLMRERRKQERENEAVWWATTREALLGEIRRSSDVITDVVRMDDPHVKVQAGSYESTFVGDGGMCVRCRGLTKVYRGLRGKKHWLCPKCGLSNRSNR